MALDFHKQAEEGTRFVKELAGNLDLPDDYNRAARILKAVLHTIRDLVSPQESMQLVAQLPLFLKGVYVDGWSLASTQSERIHKVEDLYERMHTHDWPVAEHDFPGKGKEAHAVKAVVAALSKYVSEGELDDIIGQLPKEVKPLFREAV